MRGQDVRKARYILGPMWGFGRPLSAAEMARALRLGGSAPGRTVSDWEKRDAEVKGPTSVAIEGFLRGVLPPDPLDTIRKRPGVNDD
jgi:hypothetical protein